MGAGAGYSITLSECELTSISEISRKDITLEKSEGYCSATVKFNAKLDATVNAESYYHGTGDIENVEVEVTSATLDLGFGEGYNGDILTPEAIEKYEAQFDDDIESLWKELIEVLTVDDLDISYIKSELSDGRNYEGESDILSAGWTHSTFDGEFELDDIDSRSGYNNVENATCRIVWDAVIDYIDKAVTGDNEEYTVFYNDDIADTYNTLDEAIKALKGMIDDEIAKGNADSIIFDECTVERSYYYLRNGGKDTYEYEFDWDYSEVEYAADSDDDYVEYV